MIKILLIKTSSMGDIIHTLPALSDAAQAIPDIRFDWMIEEGFAVIPTWHASVHQVISIAWRKWRSTLYSPTTWRAIYQIRQRLKPLTYDLILDAQGLLKSAIFMYLAHGQRSGLDKQSVRERLAAYCYHHRYPVHPLQHATIRMRSLFSQALHYPLPSTPPNYGITKVSSSSAHLHTSWHATHASSHYLVFLHGSAWTIKQWPEAYWGELLQLSIKAGYHVHITGGNAIELARAKRIACYADTLAPAAVTVLPKLEMTMIAPWLYHARAVVTVDTGLGHLAAALGVPTLSLYGPTNPDYTGAQGERSRQLSAHFSCAPCLRRLCYHSQRQDHLPPPCLRSLSPVAVWQKLNDLLHANMSQPVAKTTHDR